MPFTWKTIPSATCHILFDPLPEAPTHDPEWVTHYFPLRSITRSLIQSLTTQLDAAEAALPYSLDGEARHDRQSLHIQDLRARAQCLSDLLAALDTKARSRMRHFESPRTGMRRPPRKDMRGMGILEALEYLQGLVRGLGEAVGRCG
jgi:hypothetical protein